MGGAAEFGFLSRDGDTTKDHGRGEFGVDEESDEEVTEEDDYEDFDEGKVAQQKGVHKGDHGSDKHDASCGANLALVKDRNFVFV